jgi:hypothetical protein
MIPEAPPQGGHLFLRRLVAAVLLLPPLLAPGAVAAERQDVDVLRAKHAEVAARLSDSPLHAPLLVESTETADRVRADVYALVDYPLAAVRAGLGGAGRWCEVLILHLNVEFCAESARGEGSSLDVSIGRSYDQPLQDAYRVEFVHRVGASGPDYLDVHIDAKSGPAGTNEYHIRLEALALGDDRTFLHLENSFGYGWLAWTAVKSYLMTVGRDKVGFTLAEATPPGAAPSYIGGVRGLVERNAMRYYLGVEAFLAAQALPEPEQLERRLRVWFAATERYPRQLHEIDETTYLATKRVEVPRLRRPD